MRMPLNLLIKEKYLKFSDWLEASLKNLLKGISLHCFQCCSISTVRFVFHHIYTKKILEKKLHTIALKKCRYTCDWCNQTYYSWPVVKWSWTWLKKTNGLPCWDLMLCWCPKFGNQWLPTFAHCLWFWHQPKDPLFWRGDYKEGDKGRCTNEYVALIALSSDKVEFPYYMLLYCNISEAGNIITVSQGTLQSSRVHT